MMSRNAFTQLTHCSSHPAKINIVSTRCRTANVADGSKCEELALNISCPLYPRFCCKTLVETINDP
jgi:hypothetical protein